MAKRLFKTFVCCLLIIGLSGCWNSRELDKLGIVMGAGIDKADEPGKIRFIAQTVRPGAIQSAGKGAGGEEKAFWNVEETGNTVFSAIRDTTGKSSRKLYFPHCQVLVFGSSIAEEGILPYLDFFLRDHENRLNVWIAIAENKAGEVLDVEPKFEKIPANNIAKVIEGQGHYSPRAVPVRLRDFKARSLSKTTAPIAPIIGISGKDDKKETEIKGTAVFKDGRMIGKLDAKESKGLLWALGELKGGIIEVKSEEGNYAAFEIIRVKSGFKTEVKDGKVKINVSVLEEGNLGEQAGPENLTKPAAVDFLEKQKAQAIKDEIMSAVKKAKELNADIFGFGDAVQREHPKEWENMEKDWYKIFTTIEVNVEVRTKVRLVGRISRPSVPQ
ncbi:MAG: Ger(x)C family spore germination protein [Clostridiales bacterium]|nr:Ger(x)C family spore germination protein [Clostridiales bacterium]